MRNLFKKPLVINIDISKLILDSIDPKEKMEVLLKRREVRAAGLSERMDFRERLGDLILPYRPLGNTVLAQKVIPREVHVGFTWSWSVIALIPAEWDAREKVYQSIKKKLGVVS